MAKKRTKADKQERQAEQLEKKAERHSEEEASKKNVRDNLSRAA